MKKIKEFCLKLKLKLHVHRYLNFANCSNVQVYQDEPCMLCNELR